MKESNNYNEISEFNELYQELTEIADWDGLCMNLQVDMATQNLLRMSSGRNEDKKRECLRAYFYGGNACLLYTSPSPRDATLSRMPSSA